jgi:hypothetical protein
VPSTAPTAVRTQPAESTAERSRPWVIAALAVLALAAAAWLYEGHGVTFFIDEWQWIIHRHSPSEASLLEPFNNHWMAVPIGIHQVLYRVFGISSHLPYRGVTLAVHLTTSWLVFTYLRRRVGEVPALAGAAVLAFYGFAWTVTMWPISLGFAIATATAVAALLLLDRETRRADGAACAGLIIGVASTSVAVALVIGLAVELALRRAWRRVWIVAVPLAVYAIWFAAYGSGSAESSSPRAILRFVESLLAQTVGTMLGIPSRAHGTGDLTTGAHVALGIVGAGFAVLWWTLGRPRTPRLVTLVVSLAAYSVVLAVARASFGTPTTWYSYPALVLILLTFGELLKGRVAVPLLTAGLVAVAIWAVVWNLGQMRDGGDQARAVSRQEKAELAALDLVRGQPGMPRVNPSFRPENFFLRDVTAGAYFQVEDEYGTPAYSPQELRHAPADARRAADRVLLRALRIELLAGGPGNKALSLDDIRCPHVDHKGEPPRRYRSTELDISESRPTDVVVGAFDHDGCRIGTVVGGVLKLPAVKGAPPWTVWLIPHSKDRG